MERTGGLDLLPLAHEATSGGEFRVETDYFVELPSGAIYTEKQITPVALRARPNPPHRHRLLVDEAAVYPGPPPSRLKLLRVRRAPTDLADVARALAHATGDGEAARRRLAERLADPFAPPEVTLLLRPSALVTRSDAVGLFDKTGGFLPVEWPVSWSREVPPLLPEPGEFALFGSLALGDDGAALTHVALPGGARSSALGRGTDLSRSRSEAMSDGLQQVAVRLAAIEERLERLLGGGWRSSAGERAELAGEADALAELGLAELAARLRAVAAAEDAASALPAVATATAACRLLRSRLPLPPPPDEEWTPLAAPPQVGKPELLLPVCRFPAGGDEAWVCIRPKAAAAHHWVLVSSPAKQLATPGAIEPPAPWLWRPFRARLRWRRWLPLGSSDDVTMCDAIDAAWCSPKEKLTDTTEHFRKRAHKNDLKDDLSILWNGGWLVERRLEPAAIDDYLWLDETARATFRQAAGRDDVWAIVWRPGAVDVPLALLRPGGLLRAARLVHLLPGAPADRLPG